MVGIITNILAACAPVFNAKSYPCALYIQFLSQVATELVGGDADLVHRVAFAHGDGVILHALNSEDYCMA